MKRRPNWIDFGILALILVIVALVFMKFRNTNEIDESTKKEKMTVSLKVESVRDYTVNAIKAGDKVYSTDTKNYFGKVKAVEVEESYELMVKTDGELVEVRVPDKYDINLDIECEVIKKDTGYYADGVTEVKVNSAGTYRTQKAQFAATTNQIEE